MIDLIAKAREIRRSLEREFMGMGPVIGLTPADVAACLIIAAGQAEALAVATLRVTPEQHAAASQVPNALRVHELAKIEEAKKRAEAFKTEVFRVQGGAS
jgi:hypothetical protein